MKGFTCQYWNHWQVKWITLIFFFTMSLGKVVRYNSADEQSLVWESRLTRVRLSWLDNWVRASPKWQILPGFPSIQWLVCTKRGQRKDNRWTGDRVMGSQDSSVCLVMSADDVCTLEKEVTEHRVHLIAADQSEWSTEQWNVDESHCGACKFTWEREGGRIYGKKATRWR